MGCGATKSSQVDSNIEERPARHKPLTKEANNTTQNKYEDSITEDMKDHVKDETKSNCREAKTYRDSKMPHENGRTSYCGNPTKTEIKGNPDENAGTSSECKPNETEMKHKLHENAGISSERKPNETKIKDKPHENAGTASESKLNETKIKDKLHENTGTSSDFKLSETEIKDKMAVSKVTPKTKGQKHLETMQAMMNMQNASGLQKGSNIDPNFMEMVKYLQQAQAREEEMMSMMTYDKIKPEMLPLLMQELKSTVDWMMKKTFYNKNEKLVLSEELFSRTMTLGQIICAFVPVKHSDRAMLKPTWKKMVNIFLDAEVVPVIIKLLAGLWDLAYADVASLDMTTAHLIPHIMDHLIVTIQNMSYFDKKFALKCCEHDLLPHLKAWLTNLLFIFITKSTTLHGEQMILSLLAMSHQCAACYPESRPYFDQCNFLEVIHLYLTNAQDVSKTECLFCLAYIVDEENSELFSSNEDHAKYVVDFLKKTIEDIHNTSYTVDMLTKGLSRLAINDKNKKLLFDAGILEPLLHMSTGEDKEDATIATNLIRRLSFHPDIKPAMKKNHTLIKHLKKTASEPKTELTEAAYGCLLNLGEETKIEDINVQIDQDEDDRFFADGEQDPYIMISYNKIHRKQVLQIKEALETAGYRVWFDKEQMQDNTLETMVKAVWDAAVVLICASKTYEESDNCRVEVEQAFKKKKKIIPLMMESYQPSPWLDGIIGLKTFYDFSGKYEFVTKVKDLLRELEAKMVNKQTPRAPAKPEATSSNVKPTVSPVTPRTQEDVSSWSDNQVKEWITQLKLKNEKPLSGIDGEQLLFLKCMHEQAPEFYFNYLKSDLQMKSLKDMTAFHIGLKKLP